MTTDDSQPEKMLIFRVGAWFVTIVRLNTAELAVTITSVDPTAPPSVP